MRSIALLALLVLRSTAQAQCPAFDTQFADPTLNATVWATTMFDDGNGARLYAGGDFTASSTATFAHVARFDGHWSTLGAGLNGSVYALCAFDDGTGSALYAAGTFTASGSTALGRVARWNGSTWSDVGGDLVGAVRALVVHDDGSGPALFAGGDFTHAGGVDASHVARWDGTTWSALGAGTSGLVDALASVNDGNGSSLIVGGQFLSAGSEPARNVARWKNGAWSILGNGTNGRVRALCVQAGVLHAAGDFTTAGGLPANRIARWTGSTWNPDGLGLDGSVHALRAFDDGSGVALFAGGDFAHSGVTDTVSIARFDGSAWSSVGDGVAGGVETLCTDTSASPSRLVAGGQCTLAHDGGMLGVLRYDGAHWKALAQGAIPHYVSRVTAADFGTGPSVYIGGLFTQVGGLLSNGIARFSDGAWSQAGTGATQGQWMISFSTFDFGNGPRVVAGGGYTAIAGVSANSIASFDGTTWSPIGSGLNGNVYSQCVFDDGTGPALYVGGTFTQSAGVPARSIARWDGTNWVEVGGGLLPSFGSGYAIVRGMTVWDDGHGSALYVVGDFRRAGTVDANRIARWDGMSWSALGSGLMPPGPFTEAADDVCVFDDGSGPKLYVGGTMTQAGGVPVNRFARWDGTTWSAVGAGSNLSVYSLAVFDDGTGSGPALFGAASDRILRWDGTTLSTYAEPDHLPNDSVTTLTVLPARAGAPAELWSGGAMNSMGGVDSIGVARRIACDRIGLEFCSGDGSGTACPCGNAGASGNGCANSFNPLGAHLGARGSSSVSADSVVLEASGISNAIATLFQGTSRVNGGAGAVFGDGLRCAGGTTVRIAAVPSAANAMQYPHAGDVPVSVRGQVPGAGGKRTYQVWYRNAAAFCTSATFTFTNGLELTWVP